MEPGYAAWVILPIAEKRGELESRGQKVVRVRVKPCNIVVTHSRFFILPKGKKSLGTCLFCFGSRSLELFLHRVNGMLVLCCHVQWMCTCRVW